MRHSRFDPLSDPDVGSKGAAGRPVRVNRTSRPRRIRRRGDGADVAFGCDGSANRWNGAARNPMLINFKIGRFLKLNFDLALLKYQGGYDLLGLFQFRYNHFPKK